MNSSKKATISPEQIQQTAVSLGLPDHPFIGRRIVRAFDIVESDKVAEISRDDEIYRVGSQYDANKSYVVNLNHGDPSCDCPDGNKTLYCKHHIASLLYAKQEQRMSKLTIYDESKGSRYGRWRIMDYGKKKGYIVDQDSEGTLSCPCCSRSTQCRHKKAVRTYIGGNARGVIPLCGKPSAITNECGTETAKALQEKLNGSNGTGGNSHPSTQSAEGFRLHRIAPRSEFDWERAKAACLEIVPDFKLDILIHDLVKAGTLRQAHPSDYNRKEWILIFDTVKKDAAEISGNDGGDNPPSSDDEQPIAVCCICGRTLTNKLSVSRCIGPECFKKVGAQGAPFLQDDEVSNELIRASQLYRDEALQKRILRACLTLDAPAPVKVLNWLGNEFFGNRTRKALRCIARNRTASPILYYFCAAGQLNRIDTSNRKLRHIIVTRDTAETELDAHALAQMMVDVVEVEDTTADDDTPTNGDGKRKLQMDKDLKTWLVEADGTKTEISCREICEQFSRPRAANFVMQLRSGIDSGGDISTVELN